MLDEIRVKHARWRLAPPIFVLTLLALSIDVVLVAFFNARATALVLGYQLLVAALACLVFIARSYDRKRKTVVLEFELEDALAAGWQALLAAFAQMSESQRVWSVTASSSLDWKRSGGAHVGIQRSMLILRTSLPPYFQSNVNPPCLYLGRITLYFFPDRALVYNGPQIGAIPYDGLVASAGDTRFVESQGAPKDAEVLDHTWLYVNKHGGPDRRFTNNQQLPVLRYGELSLTSASGLDVRLLASRRNAFEQFAKALKDIAAALARSDSTTAEGAPVASPASTATPQALAPPGPIVDIGEPARGFWYDIVGESHYQSTLRQIAGSRLAEGEDVTVDCLVVPEPTNRYDPNALAVFLATSLELGARQGTPVGHFKREDAAVKYRGLRELLTEQSAVGRCKAKLTGGWDGDAAIGVRLSLKPARAFMRDAMPDESPGPEPVVCAVSDWESRPRVRLNPGRKYSINLVDEWRCQQALQTVLAGRDPATETVALDEAVLVAGSTTEDVVVCAPGVGPIGRLGRTDVERYGAVLAHISACGAVAQVAAWLTAERGGCGVKLSIRPPKALMKEMGIAVVDAVPPAPE